MDLWICSKDDFKLLGIVDTAESVLWVNRFRQCGDFEIYISASSAMLDLLQLDRLVVRPGDGMACIIEKVEITTDEEDGEYLTVTGRCLRSILDRRIVWEQTLLDDTVENVMRQLVTDAFISPVIEARKYEKLRLAPAHGFTETVKTQYTGDDLLEVIEELCAAYNYGFTIKLQDGYLVLDFYKGTDRSTGQSENPHVLFSEDFDTLTASTYTRDKTGYKSIALVAGEGEGTQRKRATVERAKDQTGLDRREMFVDAKDLSTNDGEISTDTYLQQLVDRGTAQISEAAEIESMSGSVEMSQTYTYGKDYNLGDQVSVRNKHGVQAISQVLEIMEQWDQNGYAIKPTFG